MNHPTRESWLLAAVDKLRPLFQEVNAPLPENIRVTMSLTKGKKILAVCYSPEASGDGSTEILIRMSEQEPVEVIDYLTHELVHAAVGCSEGHKGQFRKTALALGLEGRMKSARAGEVLRLKLEQIVKSLGKFPHAALNLDGTVSSGPKRQSTRMKKCICQECGYTVRVTQKWLEVGTPFCADISHGQMLSDDGENDPEHEEEN